MFLCRMTIAVSRSFVYFHGPQGESSGARYPGTLRGRYSLTLLLYLGFSSFPGHVDIGEQRRHEGVPVKKKPPGVTFCVVERVRYTYLNDAFFARSAKQPPPTPYVNETLSAERSTFSHLSACLLHATITLLSNRVSHVRIPPKLFFVTAHD